MKQQYLQAFSGYEFEDLSFSMIPAWFSCYLWHPVLPRLELRVGATYYCLLSVSSPDSSRIRVHQSAQMRVTMATLYRQTEQTEAFEHQCTHLMNNLMPREVVGQQTAKTGS